MISRLFAASATLLSLGQTTAASDSPALGRPPSGLSAWISTEPAGAGQSFTGFVRTDAAFSGRYEIVAERSGPAGRSTSRQSGTVDASAGTPLQLSQTRLAPLGPDDRWLVVLTIYQDDQPVARAEVRP